MVRFDLIIGFIELALLIFCLVDVISIYESRIKTLNKIAWVFIIILVPVIGQILWLAVGKERGGDRPAERARDARPIAPDDDLAEEVGCRFGIVRHQFVPDEAPTH